jgi:hypothetical protein
MQTKDEIMAEMRAMFARRDRFAQFMADERATDAINWEACVVVCGTVGNDMDVQDIVRMIQQRVDRHGMPWEVLHRWGIV